MSSSTRAPVYLLKGTDTVVLNDVLRTLVDSLVGKGDRTLMVEELGADTYAPGGDGPPDIAPVINAAQTPPFLTDARVVVARHAGMFSTAESVAPLVAYLAEPLDTTSLVLVWEKGPNQQKVAAVPKSLLAALKGAGVEQVDTSPPSQAGKRSSWLDEQMAASKVKLDAPARRMVAERLGEDVSRVGALLQTLQSTFGPGARLGVAEVSPYLGEAGGVAPWDLTDAIDQGDIPLAIERLHRLLGAGERNAIGLMFTLHSHYQRMLALDGLDVTGKEEAARLLGINAFPAGKALQQGRRLGSEGVHEAIALLARADLDLRGTTAWPPELVLEVLVARLARRARR
jgi:DNA polymerase-3 subunit delta